MFDSLVYSVNIQNQFIYYAFVLLSFLYFLVKYRGNNLCVLLILMFYTGLFVFLSSAINNLYKIAVLFYSFWCTYRRSAWNHTISYNRIWSGIFVLFSVAFFVAVTQSSGNTITIIFSQYARYIEIYLLYFLVQNAIFIRHEGRFMLLLLYQLFAVQILHALIKLILFPGIGFEALVGTLSYIGGGQGTTIPIIGFIVLWLYRQGKLTKYDWLYVIGLLLVGFTTGKRAVWFIVPCVIAAFLVYVQGIRMNKYIVLGIFAVPIVFYFGARLTPTLNPENKVWGSFDLEYMFDYAETYQFGERGLSMQKDNSILLSSVGGQLLENKPREAAGRGNATIELFSLMFSGETKKQDWFGIGLTSMYSTTYGEFLELPLSIKLAYKGAATGMFQSYVTTGILGVLTTIMFCFLPFVWVRNKRLRWVLLAIAVWEYFMYTGFIFRTPAFMAVFLFVMWYDRYLYEIQKKGRVLMRDRERYEIIDYHTRI